MMDDKLFADLCESVEQAGAIVRGDIAASRSFEYEELDVKAIRKNTGHTQTRFAALINVSVATLRSWEQCKRRPTGPARALLTMFRNDPETASRLLHAS